VTVIFSPFGAPAVIYVTAVTYGYAL